MIQLFDIKKTLECELSLFCSKIRRGSGRCGRGTTKKLSERARDFRVASGEVGSISTPGAKPHQNGWKSSLAAKQLRATSSAGTGRRPSSLSLFFVFFDLPSGFWSKRECSQSKRNLDYAGVVNLPKVVTIFFFSGLACGWN